MSDSLLFVSVSTTQCHKTDDRLDCSKDGWLIQENPVWVVSFDRKEAHFFLCWIGRQVDFHDQKKKTCPKKVSLFPRFLFLHFSQMSEAEKSWPTQKYKMFSKFISFLLLPLVITFLPPHCHSLYSTTTNERENERMNERTVTLPFSRLVHLLVTITNFLPFESFLFLLTPDRLRRWPQR
jgi:hypothetical protein